jgi:ABC-type sugar transport system substrate-binding protein
MRGLIRIVVAMGAAVALFAPAAAQAGGEPLAVGWSPTTSSNTYDHGR